MMKKLLLAIFLLWAISAHAAVMPLRMRSFATLPVQRAGRIVPLDSFARYYMKQFSGRADADAIAWLAETIFTPEVAYARETFAVAHPDVLRALQLPDRASHHYSFNELTAAMDAQAAMMKSLLGASNITDPAQQQILQLYQNLLLYYDLSRSLSLVLPNFEVSNAKLAAQLGVPATRAFSYLEMVSHKAVYLRLARVALKNLSQQPSNPDQESLLAIGYQLEQLAADEQTGMLHIIPPIWTHNNDTWSSPWQLFAAGQGGPQTAALLASWQELAVAYRVQDPTAWDTATQKIFIQMQTIDGKNIRLAALAAEYIYNRIHLFAVAAVLYALALLTWLLPARSKTPGLARAAAILFSAAFVGHTVGLSLRIFILARPPVGTLYESILFVGWVAALGSLLLERRNQQGLGIAIGALSGLILLLLAPLFAQDGGDTMEPLVAVLNTNFWLATHVLAITAGYGCCLITGLLAHVYLWQKIRRPNRIDTLTALSRAITGAALVAVCFATIGTILGGIWADQSWGRFWGWDPKENGALLIVLWLLFILHGKLSGMLRADNFALVAAGTIIIVAVSWFGVNLLNVGLHSYGFTSGMALYLGLFVAAELSILGICKILLRRLGKSVS